MDSDAGALCATVIFLILLFIHFVLAAYAAALCSVPEAELTERFSKDDPLYEQLMKWKESENQITHAAWFANVLAFTAGGMLLVTWKDHIALYWLCLLLIIVCYLFGFSLPEMVGHKAPISYLKRKFRTIQHLLLVLSPVTYVMTKASECFIRLFGVDPESLEPEVTENEIISIVNEGHEQGVLDAREAEMIQNIFELDDKNAGNIMTHRKNIVGISAELSLSEAIEVMVGESVSRFPVYEGSIDNILGVLHFKDAMKFHTKGNCDNRTIKNIPKLLREVRFIPETRGIDNLFRAMQAEKLQMVIVVDEYGQTAGLVTMEDILEEIVGSIQDEYDNEVPLIRQESEGVYLMDGMAPLLEAADTLDIPLGEEEYDTLNGWLISKLGRIPADGEQAEFSEAGYLFQILKVEDKMIRLVKIKKSNEEEKE